MSAHSQRLLERRQDSQSTVFVLGVFPPPVHGAAQVNLQVEKRLRAAAVKVIRLNLVSEQWSDVNSRVLFIVIKSIKSLVVFLGFLRHGIRRGPKTLYVSTAGGPGKYFEIPFLVFSRLARFKVFFHHHSFAYLARSEGLERFVFTLGGRRSTHVVLCDEMAKRLVSLYPMIAPTRTRVISNAAFIGFDGSKRHRVRDEICVIGFLGQVSFAKGIREFVEICRLLDKGGRKIKGQIAGPFADTEAEAFVLRSVAQFESIEYLGPCYGERKSAFFDDIDILVLPTRYRHEADPLVLHEANSRGIPVLGVKRGCIQGNLAAGGGEVLGAESFVDEAVVRINHWNNSRGGASRLSIDAYEHFQHGRNEGNRAWACLSQEVCSA